MHFGPHCHPCTLRWEGQQLSVGIVRNRPRFIPGTLNLWSLPHWSVPLSPLSAWFPPSSHPLHFCSEKGKEVVLQVSPGIKWARREIRKRKEKEIEGHKIQETSFLFRKRAEWMKQESDGKESSTIDPRLSVSLGGRSKSYWVSNDPGVTINAKKKWAQQFIIKSFKRDIVCRNQGENVSYLLEGTERC